MGESAEARQEWQSGWQGVPNQALLPWAAQMLSLLNLSEGEVLLPTLKVFSCLQVILLVSLLEE